MAGRFGREIQNLGGWPGSFSRSCSPAPPPPPAVCPAMPCSEDTLAISPSKRPRPAEEGGLRLRFVRLSEHATAPTKGSARAAGYDLYR